MVIVVVVVEEEEEQGIVEGLIPVFAHSHTGSDANLRCLRWHKKEARLGPDRLVDGVVKVSCYV